MAKPFTVGQREQFGIDAYELSVKGYSQRKIAKELGISRATIQSLLKEQREIRRAETHEFVERTLDGIDGSIAEAWRRLGALYRRRVLPTRPAGS